MAMSAKDGGTPLFLQVILKVEHARIPDSIAHGRIASSSVWLSIDKSGVMSAK